MAQTKDAPIVRHRHRGTAESDRDVILVGASGLPAKEAAIHFSRSMKLPLSLHLFDVVKGNFLLFQRSKTGI
jgi:hypothetical protein